MALQVKRSFIINRNTRLDLDKKGVGVDFGDSGLREIISPYIKMNSDGDVNYKYVNKNKKDVINEEKNCTKLLEDYNDFLEELVSVHKNFCDKINWNSISSMKLPFENPLNGPCKKKALKECEEFTPNFFEKILKDLGKKRKAQLYNKIKVEEQKDIKIYENYKKLKIFGEKILAGNIDAYFQLIDEIMPFYKLLQYGSELEIGTNDRNSIEIEFKVNSRKVVPRDVLILDGSGNIKHEEMDITTYYDIVQDYVCSCIFKIAADVINLLPVNKVVVHAVDNLIDSDTRLNNDITILSVVFDRETFEKLYVNKIDPCNALENFICNMRHQKTTGFKSVDRITQY